MEMRRPRSRKSGDDDRFLDLDIRDLRILFPRFLDQKSILQELSQLIPDRDLTHGRERCLSPGPLDEDAQRFAVDILSEIIESDFRGCRFERGIE